MKESSITDWIQILSTIIGGSFALYLFSQSNKEKRKRFILEIYDALYNDAEIVEIIYAIDRGKDLKEIKYLGRLEKGADKTLHYFDFIGQLIKDKNLKKSDIVSFKYEIKRVLNNHEVKKYIS